MQQYITIGVRHKTVLERDGHPPEDEMIPRSEAMDVKAVTDAQHQGVSSWMNPEFDAGSFRCAARMCAASARSSGWVILILSRRPATNCGASPSASIAEASSVTSTPLATAESSARRSKP